jgi:hypothetical protein
MWEAIIKLAMTLKKKPVYILIVITLILLFRVAEKKGYLLLNLFNKDSHDTYFIIPMPTPPKPEKPSTREKPEESKKPVVKTHQDSRQKETPEITAKVEAVQDKNNQLIWQKDIQNQVLTWPEAQAYCKSLGLGGYDDWRLPTISELESLVDKRHRPTINPLFGALPDSTIYPPYFWSSTLGSNDSNEALFLNFKNGQAAQINKEKGYGFARCVRHE